MNKIISKIAVSAVLFSVSIYGWAGPCMPIARMCKQMGYYKGGEKMGKGLVKDCVMPVAMGKKTLANANFTPDQLQQCKAKIMEKIKSKI